MSFRLAIAGISHETNTYCQGTTGLSEFWVLRGERISRRLGGTRTEVGGMLAGSLEENSQPWL